MEMMKVLLLAFIVICALSVARSRNLLRAIVIFMSQQVLICFHQHFSRNALAKKY